MNKYEFTFYSECPSDGDIILYTVKIESNEVIMAEELTDYIKKFSKGYQEAIADDLFKKFKGKQTIQATHQGVKITTVRK